MGVFVVGAARHYPPRWPDDSGAIRRRLAGAGTRAWRQHQRAEIDPAAVFGDVPVETVKPGLTAATLPDSFARPPGTFFDSTGQHVLTSGALAHRRTLAGDDASPPETHGVTRGRGRPTPSSRRVMAGQTRGAEVWPSRRPRDCGRIWPRASASPPQMAIEINLDTY
jgi:hypothetical protein